LGLLFGSQHADHLRHHSGARNFQLNLNFRARFCGGADSGFVEFAVNQLTLAFMQRSHLIEQRPIAFTKTFANLLDRGSLIVGQV
jgi:hypothetical protein